MLIALGVYTPEDIKIIVVFLAESYVEAATQEAGAGAEMAAECKETKHTPRWKVVPAYCCGITGPD